MITIEVPKNVEISGEDKNTGRKGVGSVIDQRRAMRASMNIKSCLVSC